jgi:NAD-dependent SIR2 family protein deacetylase
MAAMHPTEQYITDEKCIPKCPNCGAPMYLNARIDRSFVEKPYHVQRERLGEWLDNAKKKKLLLLELGSGFNTPGVIRVPMENLTASIPDTFFIRVNMQYADVPPHIEHKSISIDGDITEFIDKMLI